MIRGQAAQVGVEEDPAYTQLVPAIRSAQVEVTLDDGRIGAGSCDNPDGCADRRFAPGVVATKFIRLAGLGLPATDVGKLK